ncbi:MAG: hypothetical protein JXR95_08115 [Deltaproteobacteria bacterium]|nr:hypothetical protein [Deltaproteobacteria bacterium]
MITAGFDIGTKYVKICIVKDGEITGYDIRQLVGSFSKVMKSSYKAALDKAGIFGFQVRNKTACGFGANLVKNADFIVDVESSIAHTAYRLNPETRTVIDAGALFLNICSLSKDGMILDRAENEKCAAGSGKLLDMITSALEVPIDEISNVCSESVKPYKMSNSCAVFAESEVISRVNLGDNTSDILAGIIISIVEKSKTMYSRINAHGPVSVTGGLAHIPFFTLKLKEILNCELIPLKINPSLAGAFGAALIGAEKLNRKK